MSQPASESELRYLISDPSDPDLVLDVDGMALTSVIHLGDEVLLGLRGGVGRLVGADGVRVTLMGEDEVTEATVRVSLRHASPSAAHTRLSRFERWRATGTPLHLCAAPHRSATLVADLDDWAPLGVLN